MGAVYEGGIVGRKGGSYAGKQRGGGAVGGRLVAFISPILLVGDSFQKHTRAVRGCSEMLDIT